MSIIKNIEMVAGDRFELPMLLAYETGVVTTLPAKLFILCVYCTTHLICCQPGLDKLIM